MTLWELRWDAWEGFGLLGEGLFFARMVAQWTATERAGRPVIPSIYWWLSLAGAVIVGVYAVRLGSVAILAPNIVGVVFYIRGAQLDRRERMRQNEHNAGGFDDPRFPWPSVSVIVPVHNEEAVLGATLDAIAANRYSGRFEIIAALNGCTDGSRAVAETKGVRLAESPKAGMSWGKNLGRTVAEGDILVFVDADTVLPPDGIRLLVEAMHGHASAVATVGGRPDRGGPVVRACFRIANRMTRRRNAHAPGGVMAMPATTFDAVNGFDENLPQGTSTDLIWRAIGTGAAYVYVDTFRATTSIRRFEKTGIVRQMLSWRKNHKALAEGRRDAVAERTYDNVR